MSFHPELWVKRNETYLTPSSDTGLLLPESQYVAFGEIYGEMGYGIRDNGGVLQFKNSLGTWSDFGSGGGAVDSVNGQTGVVVLDADDIDDTSTTNKFTTASDISKLAGIEAGAEVNNISDANATDLTDGGETTLHTHDGRYYTQSQLNSGQLDSRYYTETETNTLLNAKANTADLGAVAFSNDYNDLSNLPDLTAFDNLSVHANEAAFPVTGSLDKLYLAEDTGELFRWTGSAYIGVSTDHAPVTLAGVPDYITLAGQVITRSLINLASHVTGRLPFANLPTASAHSVVTRAGTGTGDLATTTMGNDTILGREGSGNVEALSASQVRSILSVETTSQLNTRDTNNRARANHTGTQLASTISDFAATVRATVLTGLSTATSAVVSATDSILVAIGKLQAQNTAQDAAIALNTAKVTNATHTGDVTGATALTIANDVVTNAKLANVATATFKGRTTAGTGDPEDLTAAQATALLNTFTSGAKGLVPPSGGGTVNFLRADGTFAAPPGGGGSTTVNVAQTGHSLSAGNLIRSNGTNGQYAVADKDDASQADAVGYVTAVADANNFTYQPLGHYITNNVPAVAAGTALYVGDNGALTATKPETIGVIQKPVAIVVHNATAMVMFNMRGMEVTSEDVTITSTDEAIARFNGVNGGLQDSTVRITDNGSIIMPENSMPTPAGAGELKLFAREISTRIMPAFVGPSGLDSILQPFLARNKIGYWNPPGNATTVPGVFGFTAPTVTGFTATARTVTTTDMFARMRRLGYQTVATAGTVGHWRVNANQYTLGTGSGLGGFSYILRFGISDPVVVSDARMFMGMRVSATPSNVEPSTLTNCIGVGHNAAHTNLHIFYGGSSAQTPIDLGVNFPSNTSNTDVYELALFASPNTANTVTWTVTRVNTGHTATGTITGNATVIPQSNTLMAIWGYRTNNATAAAVGLDVMSAYIETDQ
jgi:hypothetical protein